MSVFTEDQRERLGELAEASEIDVSELDPAMARIVKPLGRAETLWDGIHGKIVDIDSKQTRLPKELLQKLTRHKTFRWIEADGEGISVGY